MTGDRRSPIGQERAWHPQIAPARDGNLYQGARLRRAAKRYMMHII